MQAGQWKCGHGCYGQWVMLWLPSASLSLHYNHHVGDCSHIISANFWGLQTKQPSAITMPFFCKGNKWEETFCRVNNDVNIVLIFTALLIIFNCQQPASTLRGPIFIDQRYICHAATSTFFVSHFKFLYSKCNSYFLNRMFYISHSALQYLHLLHLTQYVHFLHLLYFQFKYCRCTLNILIVI